MEQITGENQTLSWLVRLKLYCVFLYLCLSNALKKYGIYVISKIYYISALFFFLSLALVLPKYSEQFIQAKLGDDIKEAMCEYDVHSNISARFDFVGALKPVPMHIFFGLFSWVFVLDLWYSVLLDLRPLLCSLDQWLFISCNVSYWSAALPSHTNVHMLFLDLYQIQISDLWSPCISSFFIALKCLFFWLNQNTSYIFFVPLFFFFSYKIFKPKPLNSVQTNLPISTRFYLIFSSFCLKSPSLLPVVFILHLLYIHFFPSAWTLKAASL